MWRGGQTPTRVSVVMITSLPDYGLRSLSHCVGLLSSSYAAPATVGNIRSQGSQRSFLDSSIANGVGICCPAFSTGVFSACEIYPQRDSQPRLLKDLHSCLRFPWRRLTGTDNCSLTTYQRSAAPRICFSSTSAAACIFARGFASTSLGQYTGRMLVVQPGYDRK